MNINPRIDKFLWAVRIFKTRSLASEKCHKANVLINGEEVKASKLVKIGDIIEIKFPPIIRSYKVLELVDKRISAKVVELYIQETTPESELKKLYEKNLNFVNFKSGSGRPTKKDRRLIDKFMGGKI